MTRTHLILGLALAGALNAKADPTLFMYNGDKTPAEAPYADWFTTIGPGHPTGSYFGGTTWSSDGDVLTMWTQHPNDFPGATSQGIWFGRTDGYGDPSVGLNFAPTSAGNRVDARLALGAASSEWSLYWFDANGYEAAFYLLENGFEIYTTEATTFVPVASMTSFHEYGSHIYNGQVVYYLDGVAVGEGSAYTGPSNFMLVGDGSAGSVSGYGSLRVDSLGITTSAGPIVVPEPACGTLAAVGLAAGLLGRRRKLV